MIKNTTEIKPTLRGEIAFGVEAALEYLNDGDIEMAKAVLIKINRLMLDKWTNYSLVEGGMAAVHRRKAERQS